jgi:hypothetical protein
MKFPVLGASNDDPGTSAVYNFMASTFGIDWATLENRRQIPLSEDITLTDLRVIMDTAPGAGTSRTITVRKNGADTIATITVSDAATSGSWSGSVSFVAGDLIGLKTTVTGTPANPVNMYWSTFMSTVGNKALIMGGSPNVAPNGAVNYINAFGGAAWTTTSADQDSVVPTGGTLTKIAVATPEGSPGTGKSYAFSMRLNNTSDVLTATISDTNTAASATGSQALSAGDTIQLKESPSGTPTQIRAGWCFTFEPTTGGENIYGFGTATALSTSTTQYEQPLGIGNGYGATESGRLIKLPACTIKKLYVRLSAAPGAGTSRTITWRDNSAASSLAVTVSGTNTTGNDTTHSVTHTADQAGDIQSVPTTTPAAASLHIGYVIATAQPAESDYGYVY